MSRWSVPQAAVALMGSEDERLHLCDGTEARWQCRRALKQIDDKGYAEPFAKDGRALYKIGVNFSSETRGIKEWKSISL